MLFRKSPNRHVAWGPTLCLPIAGLLMATTAMGQSAQPGALIELESITVTGNDASTAGALRDRMRETPGAAAVVGAEEIEEIPNPTFSDAMAGVPGVVVQEFFGGNDQPRFQIRGSGMQQNPTERGLMVLYNGMQVNRADGSYIAGLSAPGLADAIEVWRGASANRLGATVLGGAINFISPTAITSPGTRLGFGLGSDGRVSASGQTAIQGERASGMLQFEYDKADGYRDLNNGSRRTVLSGNVEIPHANGATQLFLNYTDLSFGVPGPLTWSELDADPRQVHAGPVITGGVVSNPGPNVPRDLPRRETRQLLLGARTAFDLGDHLFDIGVSAAKTDDSFRFPISSGERVTDGYDGNLSFRYSYLPDHVAGLPLFEANLLVSAGHSDRSYYHNISGSRGPQFGLNKLKATTSSLYVGANIPLGGAAFLSPSISYSYATRDNDDRWAGATRPTVGYNPGNPTMRLPDGTVPTVSNSYSRSYSGWSPRLALTWNPAENQTAWVALSHSFEPPTHGDLLSTSGGTPNSGSGRPMPPVPSSTAAAFSTPNLKAQTANTIEVGWRGHTGSLAWDITAYYSELKNEILSLRDVSGSPVSSMNADRTRHSGLEAGLSFDLASDVFGRVAWTWQDFRFVNDPVRGNNRLGGAPSHILTASIGWRTTDRLSLYALAKWVPEETPVDNMNTLFNQPYFVADLRANYQLSDTVAIVAEVGNVFDETYAGSTLVVDRARPDQAAFIPGEGRTFYIGTELTF
ncbi:TonB-dependent receptor [Pukyongiella litopenaei]|uniref:TonB-dependent receptor n=2 Tax=Pukyongiella litopenaei TaxID=2605946 RepID=A0A2S0MUZ8_9RHOB|nr:TonB-dependent receptor [Pukyongiella litopenaei]